MGKSNWKKYAVDFELAGTVIVKARNIEEAKDKARQIPGSVMLDLVENDNFGKNYVDDITDKEDAKVTPTSL